MTHHARAGVDCPRCGQRYVDLDLHAYIDAGHTPDDLADMLHRLVSAHADTCKPTLARPSPADARRRAWWWTRRTVIPAVVALAILVTAQLDGPLWTSIILGGSLGWLAVAAGPQDGFDAYRRGYWRGRTTAHQPPVPLKDLHPADRTWLEERT